MQKRVAGKQFFITFIVPTLLALAAVGSMLLFQKQVVRMAKNQAYEILFSSANEQTAVLNEIFYGRFSILEIFANSLSSRTKAPTAAELSAQMTAVVEASDFENLAVAGTDGVAHTNDGLTDDSADRFYMTEALQGRRAIEKLENSRLYEQSRLILSVPMYRNGRVVGAVLGSFSDTDIEQLLTSCAFHDRFHRQDRRCSTVAFAGARRR